MMKGLFFMLVGPSGIPDQMGLTSHEKCDSLESCTRHQTVLGRRFPQGTTITILYKLRPSTGPQSGTSPPN